MGARRVIPSILIAAFLIGASLVFVPQKSEAIFGDANLKCLPEWDYKCPCGADCDGRTGGRGCLCPDVTNGWDTKAFCIGPRICQAQQFESIAGVMKGIVSAAQLFKSLFGENLQQQNQNQPPPQSSSGTGQYQTRQYPPCVINPATKTVSPIPCMGSNGVVNYESSIGINGVSGTIQSNISDILLKSVEGEIGSETSGQQKPNVSDTLLNNLTKATEEQKGEGAQEAPPKVLPTVTGGTGGLQSASSTFEGDVHVSPSGGLMYVRAKNPATNSEVAGFFGGGASSLSQSQSLIGRLCISRPWATGFLSSIIPPSFFDGLCKRGGYQVGEGSPSSSPPTINIRIPTQTTTPPKPPVATPVVQAIVDIWADPPSVRLGSRTYIFWNTSGVASCGITGPSFSQSTLSGGASTVPLSGSSTYTITCRTSDGQSVSDTVRVNLAI